MIGVLPFIGLVVAALFYWLGMRGMRGGRMRRERRWRTQSFYAGLVALALALGPPLDGLADELFWAHMVQHMLLQMVAPPLIVLGAPWLPCWRPFPLNFRRRLSRWLLHSRRAIPLRSAARGLGRPVVAWLFFVGTIWLSHLPAVFDFALRNSVFHEGEHFLFLSLGVLFWSRAIDSPPFHARLAPLPAFGFFLSAAAAETLLALVILAERSPLYTDYKALVSRPEHLSAIADQQLGGAIMLEPASIPLLFAIVWSIGRWLSSRDQDKQVSRRARTT
jgi:putative membrane protein